jgi:hypothetical protein
VNAASALLLHRDGALVYDQLLYRETALHHELRELYFSKEINRLSGQL